jgi:hypothetical protein
MRLNKAISVLEAKITAGVADEIMTTIQQTTRTRATAVGQMNSTEGTISSDARGLSMQVVSEANTCSMSTGSGSANMSNTSKHLCSDNVNAGSGMYANNTDLKELTLPTFTDGTSQVPLHFIPDLDLYFSLKRTGCGARVGKLALESTLTWTNMTEAQASCALTIISAMQKWQAH